MSHSSRNGKDGKDGRDEKETKSRNSSTSESHSSSSQREESERDESDGGPAARASSFMKKALTVGVGALFLTEEGLRSLVGDVKLPKELLSGILDSANKTKSEFLQNLSRDVRERVIEKIDPLALVQEFLNRNDIEFTVRVSVKPKKKHDSEKKE